MTQFQKILKVLHDGEVEFVLIGGLAAVAQGSASMTADLDICYKRSEENYKKIVQALKKHHISLRGAPKDLPFIFDEQTLKKGMNFTFSSLLGDIDLLGEVVGLGYYDRVLQNSETMELYGFECHVLTLEGLIKSKKAAARPKDILHLAELEELLKIKK